MENIPSSDLPPELRRQIVLAMLKVLGAMERVRDETAKEKHLHPTDFACIVYLLSHTEPVSPKQIIGWLNITSGAGTALLDRLERSNYIRRLPHPTDRRSVLIEVDRPTASEALSAYHDKAATFRATLNEFSVAELEVVRRFLDAMAQ